MRIKVDNSYKRPYSECQVFLANFTHIYPFDCKWKLHDDYFYTCSFKVTGAEIINIYSNIKKRFLSIHENVRDSDLINIFFTSDNGKNCNVSTFFTTTFTDFFWKEAKQPENICH